MSARFFLFGSFQCLIKDKPVIFSRQKTKTLLAYLVLHLREHSREKLAYLFWGDSSEKDARHALRVTLAELRAALGKTVVLAKGENIQINPAFPLWVDVNEFNALRKWTPERGLAALEKSLALYRGELLENYYYDWVAPIREQARALYVQGLLQGADLCRTNAQYAKAIEFAQKAAQIENINEQACRHLMVCHAAQNNPNAALQQYEKFSRALRRELGAEPAAELKALAENLRRQSAQQPSARLTNLPLSSDSFMGRKQELQRVKSLLKKKARASCLVTLTGAGGAGKSRLANQAAQELLSQYPDGVWWLDLSPLTNGAFLASSIARVLGVSEQPQPSIQESLAQRLQDNSLLLVADNCEHILPACAALFESLFAACRSLHVLTTSRELLGLANEYVHAVSSLKLPNPAAQIGVLARNEAIQFFVERAASRQNVFHLDLQNAGKVAEICVELEGMPLALELAAAQLPTHTLEEIHTRVKESINIEGQSKQGAKRRRSLRAMIGWSYNLLNETEQALFRRLAVFSKDWTLEQATLIAGGYDEAETRLIAEGMSAQKKIALPLSAKIIVHATLTSLVSKSLLQIRHDTQATRYSMLDTVRQFAREQMEAADETRAMQSRHSVFFLRGATKAWKQAYTSREAEALNQLEAETPDLRAALAFALQSESFTFERDCVAMLGRFWYMRKSVKEGREWLEQILQKQDHNIPTATLAETFNGLGLLAWYQGDYAGALTLYDQALAVYKQMKDKRGEALALNNKANIFFDRQQYAEARLIYEKSLKTARSIRDERATSMALSNLANVAMCLGENEAARPLLEESLTLRKKQGDQRGIAITLNNLGDLNAELGDLKQARAYYGESLQLKFKMGDKRGMIVPILNLMKLCTLQGKWESAAQLAGFVKETLEQSGTKLSKEAQTVLDETTNETRAALDGKKFSANYKLGQKLSAQETVEVALKI